MEHGAWSTGHSETSETGETSETKFNISIFLPTSRLARPPVLPYDGFTLGAQPRAKHSLP